MNNEADSLRSLGNLSRQFRAAHRFCDSFPPAKLFHRGAKGQPICQVSDRSGWTDRARGNKVARISRPNRQSYADDYRQLRQWQAGPAADGQVLIGCQSSGARQVINRWKAEGGQEA
jgi:hypothetical protein